MEAQIVSHYESKSTYRVFVIYVDGKRYVYDEHEVHDNDGGKNVEYSVEDEDGKPLRDKKILEKIFETVDGY